MMVLMAEPAENVEDKIVEDIKRRSKLNDEQSNIKPKVVEKTEFYANKKRGDYITDNYEPEHG